MIGSLPGLNFITPIWQPWATNNDMLVRRCESERLEY